MAIMKWGTPPGGNHHDRQAHVVGHGDGVSLVHAAFGSKVEGSGAQDMSNPNIELATKYSTAPYRGPALTDEQPEPPNPWGYRSSKREGRCMANDDTCKARAVARWDPYCNAHGRMNAGLSPFDSSQDRPETTE